MTIGWVKNHRKITDWEWYTCPNMVHFFNHLILKANHKPSRWRGVDLNVGQLITGRKRLSIETGISERSIRTCLANLEKTGEIKVEATKAFSIITLCNYGLYQTEKHDADQQPTNSRPTADQQPTTSKKIKKVKEDITPYGDIVSFLNSQTGNKYKATTKKTQDLVKARFNEGFTLEDFKTVIKNKSVAWGDDPKWSKYLRPETLFGNKFEGYLNERSNKQGASEWI